MPSASQSRADLTTVMNYLDPTSPKPVNYMYQPPQGVPLRTGVYAKYSITVHDARAEADTLSLDVEGVALRRLESRCTDFWDDAQVRAVYMPEVENFVKDVTGAVRVHAFDYNVRCRPMAKRRERGAQEPVKFAHNDYTLTSGPQRVRDLMGADADALLKNRFAVINVWKPIVGPVLESPLGVCDARSIAMADFRKQDLIYRNRVGEVYALAYSPNHRWLYFPRMAANEAMLLKCYDSDSNRTQFTAHGAFDDPTSAADAPARESIEVRTLVFFAPQT
jgi:hypothetical protein